MRNGFKNDNEYDWSKPKLPVFNKFKWNQTDMLFCKYFIINLSANHVNRLPLDSLYYICL